MDEESLTSSFVNAGEIPANENRGDGSSGLNDASRLFLTFLSLSAWRSRSFAFGTQSSHCLILRCHSGLIARHLVSLSSKTDRTAGAIFSQTLRSKLNKSAGYD